MRKTISLILSAVIIMTSLCVTMPASSAAGVNAVVFNSTAAVTTYLSNPNSTFHFYDPTEDAVMLFASANSDPYLLLDMTKHPTTLSASVYKYVVLTYRTPTTNSSAANQSELFMCAGSITAPTGGYSKTFSPTNGYKYRSQIIDMSAEGYWSGSINAIRLDYFSGCTAGDVMFLDSVVFCQSSAEAISSAASYTAAANGALEAYTEAQLVCNSYDRAKYTQPYWDSEIIYNEAVQPLLNADGTIAPIQLMYPAARVISVRNSSLNVEYHVGRDYNVTADGKLKLETTGAVPFTPYTSYYTQTQTPVPCSKGGYIYFSETTAIHLQQLAVTYAVDGEWEGDIPSGSAHKLPLTISKLENKQPLNILFYGDSITVGCNASGWSGQNCAPYSEAWYDMLTGSLKTKYAYNSITYNNTAVGGTTSAWGAENAQSRAVPYSPDLMFIGFGMNDGSAQVSAAVFKANIRSIMTAVRSANPNCEFVLVAPILANPEALVFSGCQADYLAVLSELCDEFSGAALCDVTTPFTYLLTEKRFCDMTANNVNHPNDFIVRLYAQTALKTLSADDLVSSRAAAILRITSYKNESDYRAAEVAQLRAAIAAATAAINASQTTAEVQSAYNSAKAVIDAIKTDAEYLLDELDYTSVYFDEQYKASLICQSNATTYAYNSSENALSLSAQSTNGDPFVYFDYSGGGLSANDYKYVVLTYKMSPSNSSNITRSQMFWCAGSVTGADAAYSDDFTPSPGGAWYSAVFDLSADSFWAGSINKIRLDFVEPGNAGDTMYLGSILLCDSSESANAAAQRAAAIRNGTYTGELYIAPFTTAEELSALSVSGNYTPGDANGDGIIDLRDALMLRRALSGYYPDSGLLPGADTNGDGSINSIDMLRLRLYLAGSLATLGESTLSTAALSLDETTGRALITQSTGENITAIFDASDAGASLDCATYGQIAVVYMLPDSDDGGAATVRVGSSEVSFTPVRDGEFHSAVLDFSDFAGYTGIIENVVLDFSANDNSAWCVYLDSIIFAEEYSTAVLQANRRASSANPEQIVTEKLDVSASRLQAINTTGTYDKVGAWHYGTGDSNDYLEPFSATWPAAGFTDASNDTLIALLNWNNYIKIANSVDLSQYSAITVTYGTDHTFSSYNTELGFFSSAQAFGHGDTKNMTNLVFSALLSNTQSGLWTDTKTVSASIDSNYTGPLYLSMYMPASDGVVITDITFTKKPDGMDKTKPIVQLNSRAVEATYTGYTSVDQISKRFAFSSALTVTLDTAEYEAFDRFTLGYYSTAMVRGVMTYLVNNSPVTDEFFLEASGSGSFSSLINGYFGQRKASEITSIVFYPVSGSAVFKLLSVSTEDYTNYPASVLFIESSSLKVGADLAMGGGVCYYEDKNDQNSAYTNLLNRCDTGRLVQQSYYGIKTAPYVTGEFMGNVWGYNPVQGGDKMNNASRVVDIVYSGSSLYVKCRPMDWGHNNSITPSYMENTYTITDSYLKVDNRFTDFSGYTHTASSQELPAFYTISALGNFSFYNGSSPWTNGAVTTYSNLVFWGDTSSQYYSLSSTSEYWSAWTDNSGYGIGLYVPGTQTLLAGRYLYDGSADPAANSTNYVAPLRTMTLKSGKALTYSYIIASGQLSAIREVFRTNRAQVNNSSLISY